MGRHLKPKGGHEYRRDEPAREEVRYDDGRGGFAWLYGESIGLGPEQLLERAQFLISVHAEQVAKLMEHVPRKHEAKVKALDEPRREAEAAIHATQILLANQRAVFEVPDYPKEKL